VTIAVFLGRRLLITAAVLVGISFVIFSLLALAPGTEVVTLLGGRPPSADVVRAIRAEYHLNDPFLTQYWYWLDNALHGDLGHSIQSDQPITRLIADRLPVTLELAGLALAAVLLVGVPLGYLAGVYRGGRIDRIVSGISILGLSAPAFAVAILLSYVFGVWLGWLPVYGSGQGLGSRAEHLVLPAVALGLGLVALVMRQTRAAVLDVLDQDFMSFAHARGLPRSRIVVRYALRNGSLPIVTAAGLLAIACISGTVLVETVFSVPGLGSQLTQSIQNKDIPVAQGTALLIALCVVVINVLVDIAVLILDPRTRQPQGA
jgi:peptide/nickel transport system permease protein